MTTTVFYFGVVRTRTPIGRVDLYPIFQYLCGKNLENFLKNISTKNWKYGEAKGTFIVFHVIFFIVLASKVFGLFFWVGILVIFAFFLWKVCMLYWIFNIDGVNASAVYSSATRDICCAALKPIEKKGKEQPGNTILLSASIVEPLCEFF